MINNIPKAGIVMESVIGIITDLGRFFLVLRVSNHLARNNGIKAMKHFVGGSGECHQTALTGSDVKVICTS